MTDFTQFDITRSIDLDGPVTGSVELNGVLYVFTANSMYKIARKPWWKRAWERLLSKFTELVRLCKTSS